MNALIDDEESREMGDVVPDKKTSYFEIELEWWIDLVRELKKYLDQLEPRDKRILELRSGLEDGIPHTLEEVGEMLGITRERVRQYEAKSLRKIRVWDNKNDQALHSLWKSQT